MDLCRIGGAVGDWRVCEWRFRSNNGQMSAFGPKRTRQYALECPLSGVKRTLGGQETDPFQSTGTDCYHSVYERDGNATYDTERNMLGAVLIAAVLSLVTCSTPVLAQKMSCEQFCRAHCSGAAINKNYCMSRC